jgi:hypothetical protein
VPVAHVLLDLPAQRRHVHLLRAGGGDPADRVGAEAEHVGGLLHPRVGFAGHVGDERTARHPLLAHVPPRHGRARRQEPDEVRHVAAAHQQAAPPAGKPISSAIQRTVCSSISVAERRQVHAPTFWLSAARQEVAEHADRRRARRDVAEEARVPVEQRVIEQQPRAVEHEAGCRRRRRGQARAASSSA